MPVWVASPIGSRLCEQVDWALISALNGCHQAYGQARRMRPLTASALPVCLVLDASQIDRIGHDAPVLHQAHLG